MFKYNPIRFLILIIITPLFLILFYGCNNKEIDKNKISNTNEFVEKIEGVAALGQLNPIGDVRRLAAPTSGKGGTPRLSKLLVQEGDPIIKGQILAVFDNRPKLEAELSIQLSNSYILNNEIRIKKREIKRYQELVSNGAEAFIVLEKMQDDLIILKLKKKRLESTIKAINFDLGHTQLKSPIDGIVLQVLTREGEKPNSSGVLNVGANQLMEALIEVYESDIDRVKRGQVVDLISENGGFSGSLKGQVSMISPQVRQRRVLSTDPTGDADSRVVEVTVKLDNASAKKVSHLTGMKVIARFQP